MLLCNLWLSYCGVDEVQWWECVNCINFSSTKTFCVFCDSSDSSGELIFFLCCVCEENFTLYKWLTLFHRSSDKILSESIWWKANYYLLNVNAKSLKKFLEYRDVTQLKVVHWFFLSLKFTDEGHNNWDENRTRKLNLQTFKKLLYI